MATRMKLTMNQSIVTVDFTKRWPRQFESWLQIPKLKTQACKVV